MTAQTLRKELHKLVDKIDESRLESILNDLKAEMEVLGYRPNGSPVTLKELNKRAQEIVNNTSEGKLYSIDEAKQKLNI